MSMISVSVSGAFYGHFKGFINKKFKIFDNKCCLKWTIDYK